MHLAKQLTAGVLLASGLTLVITATIKAALLIVWWAPSWVPQASRPMCEYPTPASAPTPAPAQHYYWTSNGWAAGN